MVVFMEGDIEDLVGRFDAPVPACGEQPLSGGQAAWRQTGEEVAVISGPDGAARIEHDALDTKNGAQMSRLVLLSCFLLLASSSSSRA
jgi:hypothetical protein